MPVSFDDCRVLRDSGKALLVVIPELFEDSNDTAVWVPQSQIHDDSEVYDAEENSRGRLVISDWFAEKQKWV